MVEPRTLRTHPELRSHRSFANDIYTEGQGRRLFPLIGVGNSVGALAGASVVPPLMDSRKLTV